MTEAEIQRFAMETIAMFGHRTWRMYMGGVKHSGAARKKNPLAGFPDLFGYLRGDSGRGWVAEIKTPEGRLSQEQKDWLAKLHTAGVLTAVLRSREDVMEFVDVLNSASMAARK